MKREDVRVKIPALLHLVRLGYGYLPGREIRRDRETNILTERLRGAVERMNTVSLAEETFERMMADFRSLLREADSGQGFYRILREGWNGLQILDFDHPERNDFLAGTEIACGTGKQRFRPDITLFINGLPLGMMEVKAPDQPGGLKGEYDRMCRRFRQECFRPYLQATQVWLFSNDREASGLKAPPGDGAYYTAGAPEDFPVYPGPERMAKHPKELGRLDRDAERVILEDNGMGAIQGKGAYRERTDPQTLTHRLLTGLAAPRRFLFLIRYGIRYERIRGADGETAWRKRMLSRDQLEALRGVEGKIRREFRNWTISCPGTAGRTLQGAALIALLKDRMPGRGIGWVLEDADGVAAAEAEFRRLGLDAETVRVMTADSVRAREAARTRGEDKGKNGKENSSEKAEEAGIYILEAQGPRYRTERSAASALRGTDRDAILITMGEAAAREGGYFTYLLECADGSLYCGWTNSLEDRVRAHNAGQGAKYTRSRRPVKLVYWESYGTKHDAMSREWHVKRMTRAEKMALIRQDTAETDGKTDGKEEKNG